MFSNRFKSILRRGAATTVLAMSAVAFSPAQAVIILDNWDADFSALDPAGGANFGVDFDTTSSAGLSRFISNGQSFIIQALTGPGGAPVDGDRFYEVGYLKVETLSTSGGATSNITDLIGTGNNLYFVFEGGGTLDLVPSPGTSRFDFDFWRGSLILDDDDVTGIGSDGAEVVNADGQSFTGIINEFTDDLLAASFSMPTGPGDGALTGDAAAGLFLDSGIASSDPDIIELARFSYLGPEAAIGGTVPDTAQIPQSALAEGLFAATVPATDCVAGVFFDGVTGEDLCNGANSDPTKASYYWTASGNAGNIDGTLGTGPTLGVSSAGNTVVSNAGGNFLVLLQNVGDDAAPATIPAPASLLLISLGLLGFGSVRSIRRRLGSA